MPVREILFNFWARTGDISSLTSSIACAGMLSTPLAVMSTPDITEETSNLSVGLREYE